MHVVIIEHLTPELLRRPDFLSHANGCLGVDDISGTVTDIGSCAENMRRLLGDDAVAESEDGVVLAVPSGQAIRLHKSETAGLAAMTLRVSNLKATADLFGENGVAFEFDGQDAIRVSPDDACDVALTFTRNPPA